MNIKILLGLTVYLYLLSSNLWTAEYLSIKKDWGWLKNEEEELDDQKVPKTLL